MKIRLPCVSLLALVLGACAGPGDLPSSESGTTDRISLDALALHQEELARLSGASLEQAAAAGLDETASGRALLEYVARCALPDGEDLQVGELDYPGRIGLAPEWRDEVCDGSCQRWVTACLLAHVDLSGESAEMSLRGPHPALEPSDETLDRFTVREAGYYGNAFDGGGDLFACVGDGLFQSLSGAGGQDALSAMFDYLDRRLCGGGDCGLTNTGLCAAQSELGGACGFDAGDVGGYSECEGHGLYEPLYTEVVTVHLRE